MADDTPGDRVICPQCGAEVRLPATASRLTVTCPECHWRIVPDPPSKSRSVRKALFLCAAAIAVLAASIWLYFHLGLGGSGGDAIASKRIPPPSWITINYGDLVDMDKLTHSGGTIGDVLFRSRLHDSLEGYLQPYLEPYSALCHDALLAINGPDTLPLINVVSHYPVGSAQPAWIALFREGDYQLFYNSQLIRVFIQGRDFRRSLDEHQPVIRHAIAAVNGSLNTAIRRIEVYTFMNVYDSLQIHLNASPVAFTPEEWNVASQLRPVDLAGITQFLKSAPMPEAMEVDSAGNLYLYGRESSHPNLSGSPLSLADLAVVYRAVFRRGMNAPYVSLDKNADKRLATVNFGGHLENTRIGDVLLQADKCFKSLCTGIDPDTHKPVTKRILRQVPDFLSEDQRALLESTVSGHPQARIWLYPDSIEVVTDREIGAINTDQFIAEIERIDIGRPHKGYALGTVEHFNQHYAAYENVFESLRDLRTIGRLMALFGWLKRMKLDTKVALDDFLTIELPAYTTPGVLKRMIAATAVVRSEYPGPTPETIRKQSKVYDVSSVLDDCQPGTAEWRQQELAAAYLRSTKFLELVPPRFQDLKSRLIYLEDLAKSDNEKLDSLDKKLEISEQMLDNSDRISLDRHNRLIDEFNRLVEEQKSAYREGDSLYAELKKMKVAPYFTISSGGGISLRRTEFKRVYLSRKSPRVKEVAAVRSKLHPDGPVSRSGDWMRSNAGNSPVKVQPVPISQWTFSRSADEGIVYEYVSDHGDRLVLSITPEMGRWNLEMSVNGATDAVEYFEEDRYLQVSHPNAGISGNARVTTDKRIVNFHR